METARDADADSSELQLLTALRAGDEAAFTALVERHHNAMVRIAMIYVKEQPIAEEVAQDTWMAVLRGLDRFEGRSSLKTWLFTILTNRAKTRATREGRYVPLELDEDSDDERAISLDRFNDDAEDLHHWLPSGKPKSWESIPETRLLSLETIHMIMQAIETLPPTQKQVIRLRDVEGFSSVEICNILNISETNQRVLLHRARSRVRQALENYLQNEA